MMLRPWAIGAAAFVTTIAAGAFFYPSARSGSEPSATGAQPAAQTQVPATEKVAIPTLGLSVERPESWSTLTVEENVRNLRGVEMDDRELQGLAARYAATPIIAFSKYKEPYDDLNPTFKINVRPIGGFAGHRAEEILLAALPTMRRMFGDLKVDYAPTETTLSGKPAAYTRLTYTLRASGREFPAVSEIWVVPAGSIFFMIGTGTRADEKTGSRGEVRAIVDSVHIE